MADKTAMSVKLDPTMRERLQVLGSARRRSPHWLMVEAIRLDVEREEGEERENAIARERLARYDGSGESMDGDEVHAWAVSLGTDQPLPRPPVREPKKARR